MTDRYTNNPLRNAGAITTHDSTTMQGEAYFGTASISGNGSQVGAILKGGKGSVLVSVAGTLLAIGMAGMLAIASISGGGSQVAIKKATVGSAIVSGGGALIPEGKKNGQSSISVSANGKLTSSGAKFASTVIQISGNGLLETTSSKQGSGDSSISGNGSIIAEGCQPEAYSGIGVISGNGSITLTGEKNAKGTLSMTKEIPIIMLSSGKLAKKITPGFYINL